MASNNFSATALTSFSGQNYPIWAAKMKNYLKAFDLWKVVESDDEPAVLRQNPTVAQMKHHSEESSKKFKALFCIQSCLDDKIGIRIMHCETAKQAWDLLQEEFHGSERTRMMQVLNLKREFESLKMKETETVREFSDRLMLVVNQIRMLKEELTDARVVEKVLVSLPERFEAKISSLEDSKDLSKISLSELTNALQATEQRRTIRLEENSESALFARQKDKRQAVSSDKKSFNDNKGKVRQETNKEGVKKDGHPPCPHCKKQNHLAKYCWYRPDAKCGACHQLGHITKVCKNKRHQNQQAQVAESSESASLFVAICEDSSYFVKSSSNGVHTITTVCNVSNELKGVWLIDSGCTSHMTGDPDVFKSLDTTMHSKVKLGNGEFVGVNGKGTVEIQTLAGMQQIPDVLYVPKLSHNLLSVGQMMDKKYILHFENGECVIHEPSGSLLMIVKMKNRSFPIDFRSYSQHAYPSIQEDSKLWHKRLGHFSHTNIKLMHSKNLVKDLPSVYEDDKVCATCQSGKHSRLPFSNSNVWRASHKLELVHSDICGPMSISSLNGNKYFVIFIDDFTRMCWVFFIRQKSEVLNVFKKFKAEAENQSGYSIKKLRSDNGGEYTSKEFKNFCQQTGIVQQLTAPYSPQQNGVSERKNKSIMEMARCLMFEKDVPKLFWAEAVNTAVYLLNLLPTKAINDKVPIEAWNDVKPSVQHLKIFGSMCYSWVPEVRRNKLDQRSEVGMFLGYCQNSKAYRIYNLKAKKIQITREVKVDENSSCNWEELLQNSASYQPIRIGETQSDVPEIEAENEPEHEIQTEGNAREEDSDDTELPVRGTRTLEDIFERCNIASLEPANYDEASKLEEWKGPMEEEIAMIEKNNTWELVDKPQGYKPIGVKWIYRTKYNPDGSINKRKARLVAKGYSQKYGVDYNDTFAPVARHETIRMLAALAAKNGWRIFHMDVKSAFLNGLLEEEIYIQQPEGFIVKGDEDKVYKLRKALYGLKQAPRAWYSKIDSHFLKQGFIRSENEATMYVLKENSEVQLIISLYVDDLLLTGRNNQMMKNFQANLKSEFEMSHLGEMKYFLGMEFDQTREGIFVSQRRYAIEMLRKFHMERSKHVATPLFLNEKLSNHEADTEVDASRYRSIIGSLLYLCSTRPDIMYSTSLLSRFGQDPRQGHFAAAKRVLRYIKGTCDYGLWFKKTESQELIGYSDSDWAGSVDDAKSTSGYLFSMGSAVFSWNSKKQEVVAQSSAESEYISAAAASNQAIWLRKMMKDLQQHVEQATIIWVDNKSAIAITENPVQHGRTKHINVKYHAIRQAERDREIKLEYCRSEEQLADILTKALPKAKFEDLRYKIGIIKKCIKEEC